MADQPLRLKVGMLSTWNAQCAISEYTRDLVYALRELDDLDVMVLGSRDEGARRVREDEDFVRNVFTVEAWHGATPNALDVDAILEADIDLLHVQYQEMFFDADRFEQLLSEFSGVKAVTFHDNHIPDGFPHHLFDVCFTHRLGVGQGNCELIPLGMHRRRPVVKTLGLARNRWETIRAVCDANDWQFDKLLGDGWVETDELERWVRDADAIVLWYADDPKAGSSAAARLALASGRPVVVNDVTWFAELPRQAHNFRKVADVQELTAVLDQLLNNPFAQQNSWELVARLHRAAYHRQHRRRLQLMAEAQRPPASQRQR